MGVFDFYGQLITCDDSSYSVTILSEDLNISISGDTKITSNKGIYIFDNVIISGRPKYIGKVKFLSTGIE